MEGKTGIRGRKGTAVLEVVGCLTAEDKKSEGKAGGHWLEKGTGRWRSVQWFWFEL
jgi:hypothetical protein